MIIINQPLSYMKTSINPTYSIKSILILTNKNIIFVNRAREEWNGA